MIQCRKIYILCFVLTKYISVANEYIISALSISSYVDLRSKFANDRFSRSRQINILNFLPIKYFHLFSLAIFEILIFLVPFKQYVSSILHVQFETKMFTLPCLCKNAHCMLIVDTLLMIFNKYLWFDLLPFHFNSSPATGG